MQPLDLQVPQVALPIGISFYSFTQIAFLVDAHPGKVKETQPLHCGLSLTDYPPPVAGRVIFAIGLFKQVVLADGISPCALGTPSAVASPHMLRCIAGLQAHTGLLGCAVPGAMALPGAQGQPHRQPSPDLPPAQADHRRDGPGSENAQTLRTNKLGDVCDHGHTPAVRAVALIGDSCVGVSMLGADQRLGPQLQQRHGPDRPVCVMGSPGTAWLEDAGRVRDVSQQLAVRGFVTFIA